MNFFLRSAVWNTVLALTFLTFFISCSTPSQTADIADKSDTVSSSSESDIYPEWFDASRSVHTTEEGYHAFSSAIAADSIEAEKKAVAEGKSLLKALISTRMEEARSEAAQTDDKNGLREASFIIVLRKTENRIPDFAEIVNTEMRTIGEGNGYRAFAEVELDSAVLMEDFNRQLSEYMSAWNAMKKAEAFSAF